MACSAGRLGLVGLFALTQASCVSLLPQAPPVQLYAFGRSPPPVAAPAKETTVSVALSSVSLPRAAIGDQLLSVTGREAAYIAGARWITPADVMFQEDVERAFDAHNGPVRLVGRGDLATPSALLVLDVEDFEARYDNGAGAAPVILVSVRAILSRPDGQTLAIQTFTLRRAAVDNRVAPIVDAFDQAATQVLGQIVVWTESKVSIAAAGVAPGPDR